MKPLYAQEARARAVINGERAARSIRFVKNSRRGLDEASLARAQSLVGIKGCVTNIPTASAAPTQGTKGNTRSQAEEPVNFWELASRDSWVHAHHAQTSRSE